MRAVATGWFWLVLLVTFPIGYAMGLVLLVVSTPFDPERHALARFLYTWCHQYIRSWPGWRARVIDAHKLPKGPCVLIANHQSMADILALMGLPLPFKFVSKASLFSVPLTGFMMKRMHHVAIERGKVGSTQEMISACEHLLDIGESVLIFPEGTYSNGASRLPWKRGAFLIAQRKQVPVVPVLLEGTAELVFEDGPSFAPRSDVRITVKDPVMPPPVGSDDDRWAHELERNFAQWLGKTLRASSAASPPAA